jgi:recombination protein RecR
MQSLAQPVSDLIDAFSRLPGIGPKSASRLAYFLLRSDEEIALSLATALQELKAHTLFCGVCHNIADRDPCAICDSEQRDRSIICVVEEPLDVQAIERTGTFHGLYHVLHGAISPVEGIGPDDLKLRELLDRLRRSHSSEPTAAGVTRELLVATNPNLEGEATAMYIARLIKPLGVRVTRLARGLPTGGDLEYADEMTLSNALAGRLEM